MTFIERVKARHGDRIDCSQTVFVDMATEVLVSCSKHGKYLAKPRTLLECGTGCKECAKEAHFLSFLDRCIEDDPSLVVPADEDQLERLEELLSDVD